MTAGTIPPERPGYPAPPDLAERRAQMQGMVEAGAWKTARPPVETVHAGRRTLRFSPEGTPRGYVLSLHGGGFRIGRPEFESFLAEVLAARCGAEVLVPQYRLAPEGPFPAGLNDALAALRELREKVGSSPLIVCGDSAGGNLAAVLGVLAGMNEAPPIDGLVLLSPWLDLRVSAPSYEANAATDQMFSTESAQIAADLYLQGFDAAHPLVSPLLAPIAVFPPTLISVGCGEVLRDDALAFHDKLVSINIPSELSAIEGMEHVAVVRSFALHGAAETLDRVVAFVERILPR